MRLDAQGKPVLENSQIEKGRIEDVSEVDKEFSERMKDEYAKWEDGA